MSEIINTYNDDDDDDSNNKENQINDEQEIQEIEKSLETQIHYKPLSGRFREIFRSRRFMFHGGKYFAATTTETTPFLIIHQFWAR